MYSNLTVGGRRRMVGTMVCAVIALGGILSQAASASAAPEWKVSGFRALEGQRLASSGELTFTYGGGAIRLLCHVTTEMEIGKTASIGKVLKWKVTTCSDLTGPCPVPTVEATGLPWSMELVTVEGKIRNKFNVVSGGYQIKCESSILDECSLTPLSTALENVAEGVKAIFESTEERSCGFSHLKISGSELIKTPSEKKLSVS